MAGLAAEALVGIIDFMQSQAEAGIRQVFERAAIQQGWFPCLGCMACFASFYENRLMRARLGMAIAAFLGSVFELAGRVAACALHSAMLPY